MTKEILKDLVNEVLNKNEEVTIKLNLEENEKTDTFYVRNALRVDIKNDVLIIDDKMSEYGNFVLTNTRYGVRLECIKLLEIYDNEYHTKLLLTF